jgi:hypothetical protein
MPPPGFEPAIPVSEWPKTSISKINICISWLFISIHTTTAGYFLYAIILFV